MSANFTQTLQGLSADKSRGTLVMWGAASIGLVAWGLWFGTAEITLYESALSAQMQAEGIERQISVPAGRELEHLFVGLGQVVKEGDVLAEFDSTAETLAVTQGRAQLAALAERVRTLQSEIDSREAARQDSQLASAASIKLAENAGDETAANLEFARGRVARLAELQKSGGASAAELLKARADLAALQSQQKGRATEVLRIGLLARADDRRAAAEIDAMRAGLSDLRLSLGDAQAALVLLQRERDRRTIRAQADGVIADLAAVGDGSVLQSNAYLLTLIPEGELVVSAQFDAGTGLGLLAAGQTAVIRHANGSDRTSYAGHVTAVGASPLATGMKVELSLDASALTFRHGQAVFVDVATRSVTPLTLILSALGWGGNE